MKQQQPLTIINAKLVLPGCDKPVTGALRTDQGVITAAGPDVATQADDAVIDAKGQIVAPSLVDLGVFAVDKPAFRFGGITRAALMPDQSPVLDDPAAVRYAALSGKPDLWVHPLAAATADLADARLGELALMKAAGARAVATGRQWISDSGVMLRVLQQSAALGLVVISHAEDSGIAGKAVATAGEMATRLGLPAAPAEAEALAVARDIMLAEMAVAAIHFRQLTTRAGLDLVRKAKARGVMVTAGVTPAHILLNDLELSDYRTFARFSPPLRCEDDRQAVLQAVSDGTIDVIASGHDPRGPEDKRLPFADALPGMAGAETLLSSVVRLVSDGTISWCRAFDLLAANPARLLGVNCGRLEPEAEADFAIISPDRSWIVDSDRMAASAGNTPFDKRPMEGRVTALFKGGVPV